MSYRLLQTAKAKDQLLEIALYIAQESGEVGTALGVLAKLEESMNKLGSFPHRGSPPRDPVLRKQGHRVLLCESYLIFYRCDDATKTVTVTAIMHSRRNYANLVF